jgi:hemolysin-activating ACP:hemolysin acyltransferase
MDNEPNHTQLLTGIDPARALGLAVSYLMAKPAFAKLPFGFWTRVLVGQINRGHYLIAQRDQRVVGFLGWALTSRGKAEIWLSGKGDLSFKDSQAGEILLINAWAADTNDVTQLVLERLREIGQHQQQVYYKRFYPDGRVRPCRLAVNTFVDAYIRAARQTTEAVMSF